MIRSVPQHQTAQHLLPGQIINPLPPDMPGLYREAAVTPEERQAAKRLPLHKCSDRCNINCMNWRARQGMLGHFPMNPQPPV